MLDQQLSGKRILQDLRADHGFTGMLRLRELVFQLAATGRLVPRVQSECDAETLITAISSERNRLADAGEVSGNAPRRIAAIEL